MKNLILSVVALVGLAGSLPAADVRYVRQCYVDQNGFERCRTVPVAVETSPTPSAVSTTFASEFPCPCVGAKGYCDCAAKAAGMLLRNETVASSPSPVVVFSSNVSWVQAARANGVWFPRLKAFNQNRPKLFGGRLFGGFGLSAFACPTCK